MQTLSRRTLLSRAGKTALAGALATAFGPGWAQGYPTRPVRMLVGFPPGGATDVIARLMALEFAKTFQQQFLIDNKGGANGTIATAELVRTQPTGQDLMFTISSHVTNGLLYKNLSYDAQKDITPIALVARSPFVLVAHPAFKASTIADLIAMAKAAPGAINFASPGPGSTQHLALELLKSLAGIDLAHVPYRGGAPAMNDVIAGQVPLFFATISLAQPYIEAGRLKALGVTSASRVSAFPNVPTIAEAGVAGYEADVWFGLIGPKNLPPAVVQSLYQDVVRMASTPEFQKKIQQQGATLDVKAPGPFAALLREEDAKWGALIKKHHIEASS